MIEFAAFAAGPCVGKYLANHGAFVAKVESRARLDGFRTHYPPFKDNKPGVNRSGVFAMNNDGVHSVGINLKAPGGIDIATRLIAKADVVIENFTPGTMQRLGLGYSQLKKLNPGLVMLSTCNLGQTGPRAEHPGFGSQLTSLSGFTNLIGEPDRNPVIAYGPYIDYIAVGYAYVAVLAALEYRRRTGRGQHIDLAQYEGGVHFLAPGILQYHILGTVPGRQGNRHAHAAPHGVYPCKEPDTWCTISVFDDPDWNRLVQAMGKPQWSQNARFATRMARKENEPELDRHLSEWTRSFRSEELMVMLQNAGVYAGKISNIAELFGDTQLVHRAHWATVDHPECGPHHAETPAFQLSATPHTDAIAEPLLSEHTELVLQKLLNLSSREIADFAAQGAVELAAAPTSRTK